MPITAPVLDDFNRANGPAGPPNWSSHAGGDIADIFSNTARYHNGGVATDNYWDPTTFGPDCEAFIGIATASTFQQMGFWIDLRLNNPTNPGTQSGYEIVIARTLLPTVDTLLIQRIVGGVYTTIYSAALGVTFASGDEFGADAIGSGGTVTVTAYRNPSGGSWGVIGSFADTDANRIVSAGNIGWGVDEGAAAPTWAYDDFGAATLSSGVPSPPVGTYRVSLGGRGGASWG